MRKLIVTLIALIGMGATGLAFAAGTGQGVVGSPHDFTDNLCLQDAGQTDSFVGGDYDQTGSGTAVAGDCVEASPDGATGWNASREICRVCHVPHRHGRALIESRLWNHELSNATSYTIYDVAYSSSIDGTTSQPQGKALLCLGCHDGSTALDSFDEYTATAAFTIEDYSGEYKYGLGTGTIDIRGEHPLSIEYNVTKDPGLNAITDDMGPSTETTIEDVLEDIGGVDLVQCSSCHDVHDTTDRAMAGTPLLREYQVPYEADGTPIVGATESGLCLTCHDK
jgi:hypothetical protein